LITDIGDLERYLGNLIKFHVSQVDLFLIYLKAGAATSMAATGMDLSRRARKASPTKTSRPRAIRIGSHLRFAPAVFWDIFWIYFGSWLLLQFKLKCP
jgi:hypothetical protein